MYDSLCYIRLLSIELPVYGINHGVFPLNVYAFTGKGTSISAMLYLRIVYGYSAWRNVNLTNRFHVCINMFVWDNSITM